MQINIADWVKKARTKANLTQEQLANRLAMTKANISSFKNGRSGPSFMHMIKICQICDVSLPSNELKSPTIDTAVIINELTVTEEYGKCDYSDYFELKGGLSFSKKWLREMEINPNYCYVIFLKGMSMYPTLHDGQAVLIDTSRTEPTENKIYLIARDLNELIMKRTTRNRIGEWVYTSDNVDKNRYPDMPALKNDKIIGRVVWIGGKLEF